MGPHTLTALRRFRSKYPLQSGARVLEVGSCDWNGSVRKKFSQPWIHYTGYDLKDGPGVDVSNPKGLPLRDVLGDRYDLVICCDVLEHCLEPWNLVSEMGDVLDPNGLLFVLAPMAWPKHFCPIDCYRFLPDGLRYLATRRGLKVLECYAFQTTPWFRCFMGLHWIYLKWLGVTEKIKTGHAHTVLIAQKP